MEIESKQKFEWILSVLSNAKTDNERMASLYVLTKSLDAKLLIDEERHILFDAVGFKFINRLLKTEKVPEGSSPNEFRALAIAVLSCFCTDDALILHPAMIANLETINKIIASVSGNVDENDRKMLKECYDILASVASKFDGQIALCEHGSLSAICHSFAADSCNFQLALQIVRRLVLEMGELAWNHGSQGLIVLLEKLSEVLKDCKDERAFVACDMILDILRSIIDQESVLVNGLMPGFWTAIYSGLFDMLRSKIGETYRISALKLASEVVRIYGIEAMSNYGEPVLPLVVHCVYVELHMILEFSDLDKMTVDKADLLLSCFMVLESAAAFLYGSQISVTNEKQALQLHSAMKFAFTAVTSYLEKCQQLGNQQLMLSSSSFACMRFLGALLGEEDYVQNECVETILPLIFNMCILTYISRYHFCTTCKHKLGNIGLHKVTDEKVLRAVVTVTKDADKISENQENVTSQMKSLQWRTCSVSNSEELNEYISAILFNVAAISEEYSIQMLQKKDPIIETEPLKNLRVADKNISFQNFENYDQIIPWYSRVMFNVHECVCDQIIPSVHEYITQEDCVHTKLVSLKIEEAEDFEELPDLVKFIIPGFPLICDNDKTRSILYECHMQYLLVAYFCNKWHSLMKTECNTESVIAVKDLCETLLNLLAYTDDLPKNDPALIHLLGFLYDHLHEFVGLVSSLKQDDSQLAVSCHLLALGLKLSTTIAWKTESKIKGNLKKFVKASVTILSTLSKVKVVDDVKTLVIGSADSEQEDLNFILFLTALEGMSKLVEEHREIASVILKSEWVKKLIDQLIGEGGNVVFDQRLLIELENLLCSLAEIDEDSKSMIIAHRGFVLARRYKMKNLELKCLSR